MTDSTSRSSFSLGIAVTSLVLFAFQIIYPLSTVEKAAFDFVIGLFTSLLILKYVKRYQPKYAYTWIFVTIAVFLAGLSNTIVIIDDHFGFHDILFQTASGITGISGFTSVYLWIRSKKSRWELSAILDAAIVICALALVAWEATFRLAWGGHLPSASELPIQLTNIFVATALSLLLFHILRSSTAGFVPAFRYMLSELVFSNIHDSIHIFAAEGSRLANSTDTTGCSLLFVAAMVTHPTMIHFTQPAPPVKSTFGPKQLALLAFALMMPVASVIIASTNAVAPDLRVWVPLSVVSLICVAGRVGTVMKERDGEQNKVALHAKQQESVAELGRRALVTFDFDEVVSAAFVVLKESGGVRDISLWGPPSNNMIVCQSSSDDASLVGSKRSIDESSCEGRAAISSATSLDKDSIAVVIGTGEQTYGFLSAGGGPFGHSEAAFFEQIATVLAMAMRRNQDEQESRQSQRFEAVGRLSGGIAHEINTPIQFIGDNLKFLRSAFDDVLLDPKEVDLEFLTAEVPLAFDECLGGVERMRNIVAAMKTFGDQDYTTKTSVDLNDSLSTTLMVAQRELEAIDVRFEQGEIPTIVCNAGEMNQVLLNVILNAVDAIKTTEREGLITLRTWSEANYVNISVADNGSGITEAITEKIWDPFFTTKVLGQGTGQGLTLVKSVVNSHNGDVSFSTSSTGTEFVVRLPID